MLTVSVIIPCYNQGQYVLQTLESVLKQTYQHVEVIIVNDGSDDQQTVSVLNQIDSQNVQLIHTDNRGLASARNTGIKNAIGQIILPLDADDLIAAEYIEKAVEILEENRSIGIVYCRAQLFGSVETEWLLPPYSLDEMLLDNVIFCSALFRKSDWKAVGGYNQEMIYGWEDYDFWLSLIERGCEVYQIPEILFSYRVASDSMVRTKEKWKKVAMFNRIFESHQQLFTANIDVWIDTLLELRSPYYSSKLYVDTGNGVSEAECVHRKVDRGTSEIQFSLDGFDHVLAIRFDPIDTPAIIEIHAINTLDKYGKTREISDYTDNSIFHEGNDRYFDTDDSQFFFSLESNEIAEIDTIIIQLSFKALAGYALQEIVTLQKNRIGLLSDSYKNTGFSGLLEAFLKFFHK